MKIKDAIRKKREEFKNRTPVCTMPSTLATRYRTFILISLGTAIMGIAVGAVGFPGDKWYMPMSIFLIMAAAMFIMATAFKWSVIYKGYEEYEGTVVFIKTKALSLHRETRDAVAYHVKTDDKKTYSIPVYKSSADAPVGERVTFIVPKNATPFERDGLFYFPAVWGYYLTGSGETEEKSVSEFEPPAVDQIKEGR